MLSKITAVALAATLVSAQTHTLCDPTKQDCPNPKALGATVVDHDFRTGKSDFIKDLAGTYTNYDKDQGAVYTIKEAGNAPTTQSGPYIFFGQLDVELRVAPGAGIVTSVVLQSDDLDEIDWEWVGSDHAQVQTNYFSKGCTATYDRGGYSPVADAQERFHTYTIKWTPTQLDWIIDGTVVRTLKNEGLSGCSGYPQSPMQVKLGSWVAGNPSAAPGTIQWAGGLADFSKGPFTAAYKSIKVTDFMGGQGAKAATEYVYTDRSGTWQSIKVVNDGKTQSGGSSSGNSTSSKPTGTNSTATTLVPTSKPTSDVTDSPSSTTGKSGGAPGSSSGSTTTTHPHTTLRLNTHPERRQSLSQTRLRTEHTKFPPSPNPHFFKMSLRIVPADSHPSTFTHISDRSHSAPSAPGLHDTLRAGVGPSPFDATSNSTAPASAHPLEARLKAWEATREQLRMSTLRRTFGMAEPIRRGMELKITREGEWRPLALSGAGMPGVHEEILSGRDEMITWEDVFTGETSRATVSIHDELERKLKI